MPDSPYTACAECGGPFKQKHSDHRFCSKECRTSGYRSKRCEVCDKFLDPTTKGNRCRKHANGTVEERLEKYLDKSGDCWIWTGTLNTAGYAHLSIDGMPRRVHRVIYQREVGPIPEGLVLDHLCRNRACCNPAHLEPVTDAENSRRGLRGELKTHCSNGHPWIPANRYINGKSATTGAPKFRCRICCLEQQAVARAAKREARAC